jgi:iron-sulfur cluster assembly protein
MSEQALLQLTPQAIRQAKDLLAQNGTPDHGIRVGVRGGGCSGLSYFIEMENEEKSGDRILEFDGLRIFVDLKSQLFLGGTEIDWSESLMERGFHFKNPNAQRSCSCGESFTV